MASREEFLADFGDVKNNKTFSIVKSEKKIACISKKQVSLQDYKDEYGGASHKLFSEEEVKRRHLGKIRCIIKFKTDDDLKNILTEYFKNEDSPAE